MWERIRDRLADSPLAKGAFILVFSLVVLSLLGLTLKWIERTFGMEALLGTVAVQLFLILKYRDRLDLL